MYEFLAIARKSLSNSSSGNVGKEKVFLNPSPEVFGEEKVKIVPHQSLAGPHLALAIIAKGVKGKKCPPFVGLKLF